MATNSVRIPEKVHKEILKEKETTGININKLIEFAWNAYKKEKKKK